MLAQKPVMSVRRGFLRLWIVASCVVVLAVVLISYRDIRQQFEVGYVNLDDSMVPVPCTKARGLAFTDYSQAEGFCWYKLENLKRLYPELKDFNDTDLSSRFDERAGWPARHVDPWGAVRDSAEVGLGIPAAIFVLGYVLIWAFAGFTSHPPR